MLSVAKLSTMSTAGCRFQQDDLGLTVPVLAKATVFVLVFDDRPTLTIKSKQIDFTIIVANDT